MHSARSSETYRFENSLFARNQLRWFPMDPKAQSFVSNPQDHRCRGSVESATCRTQARIAASACIQCGGNRSTAPPPACHGHHHPARPSQDLNRLKPGRSVHGTKPSVAEANSDSNAITSKSPEMKRAQSAAAHPACLHRRQTIAFAATVGENKRSLQMLMPHPLSLCAAIRATVPS